MTGSDSAPNRRPIASRSSPWAAKLTTLAVQRGITPNQISLASIGFALLGLILYMLAPLGPGIVQWLCLILAAATCLARLVCNLIDGMVAVEGGQGTKDGAFWNEAPDRVSDMMLLTGAGIAAGSPILGALGGAMAIACAYVREFGRAEGFAPDFGGLFAKPGRMVALIIGTVLAAFYATEWTLSLTLWVILLGTTVTLFGRVFRLIEALKTRSD
jgi:phosphatidylglycerophosphate synthase